jgi:CheY-like chemotaxis protein
VWQIEGSTTLVGGEAIPGRVLVVENDDAIRTMLLTVLEVSGYEVNGVRSGADGLTVLQAWRPDVIVLDLYMPVMDGRQFLERRSLLGDLAAIPVVVVTVSTSVLPTAERLGVRAVLQQPHDVSHLRSVIDEAIVESTGESAVDESAWGGQPL